MVVVVVVVHGVHFVAYSEVYGALQGGKEGQVRGDVGYWRGLGEGEV